MANATETMCQTFPKSIGESPCYDPSFGFFFTILPVSLSLTLNAQTPVRPSSPVTDTPSPELQRQINGLLAEKENRTPAQLKLQSNLHYAIKLRRGLPICPEVPRLETGIVPDVVDDCVLLDVTATVTDRLRQTVYRLGGNIINTFPESHSLRIRVPLMTLETLADLPEVTWIKPASKYRLHTSTEGDKAHAAILARSKYKADGTGVTVGVISDSVDMFWNNGGSEMGSFYVLNGQSGIPDTGEGAAMLKILYDLAPGATRYFATGKGGPVALASAIRGLKNAGCQVIVDDFTYEDEPPFQDNAVCAAINEVYAAGGMVFTSSGEDGNKANSISETWEGDFVSSGLNFGTKGTLHSWNGSTYNVPDTGGGPAYLFWADPLGKANDDYDLFVTDSAGKNVLRASTNVQNGSQDAVEKVDTVNTNERIYVVLARGNARYLHLDLGGGILHFNTNGRIRGHNASPYAFTVGGINASGYSNPFAAGFVYGLTDNTDGPRRQFFTLGGDAFTPGNFSSSGGVVFNKPDGLAATNVATGLRGFSPFTGTSASATHAAGIATLLKSFKPGLTNAQIFQTLRDTALPIGSAGYNPSTGYGVVMAGASLGAYAPTITKLNPSHAYIGGSGFYLMVTGKNFDSGQVVQWSDGTSASDLSTTFINSNILVAFASASLLRTPGTFNIQIKTPQYTSNAMSFSVILGTGGAVSWGDNFYGQLGAPSSLRSSLTPQSIANLSTNAQLFNGYENSFALDGTGTVYAWGRNDQGQLGLDNGFVNPTTPMHINNALVANTKSVAVGSQFTLFLKTDGTVSGVGGNYYGQLGDGTGNNHSSLIAIPQLSNLKSITAGLDFALGLKNDGTVIGWGNNDSGQLGDGTRTSRLSPVQVSNLTGVKALATGSYHAMALKTDGTVWTWGDNTGGQLGDGTNASRTAPSQVSGLSNIIAVAAGRVHSYALGSDGKVWAWGYNASGELGIGTTNTRTSPVQVSNLPSNIIQISSASSTGFALANDGHLFSWGYSGLLGSGSLNDGLSPAPIPNFSFLSVSAGNSHVLAKTGIGQPDLYLRDATTGSIQYFLLNNNLEVDGQNYLFSGNVADWQVVAMIDFNKDGNKDLVLQNQTTGRVYYWLTSLGTISGQGFVWNQDVADFRIKAYADLNGDGYTDLILQNQKTGQIYYWLLGGANNAAVIGSGYIYNQPLTDWNLVAAADFTGDGKTDLLFQNKTTGEVYLWVLNGTTISTSRSIFASGLAAWKVFGSADVNGDGKPDILLQNQNTGQIYYWSLNADGTAIANQGSIWGGGDKNWVVVATPDLDKDGTDDVVVQNSVNGQVYYWTLKNGIVNRQGFLSYGNLSPLKVIGPNKK